MAAEDIDLKLVIKALLDSKGFEEAQVALKKFGGTVGTAGPSVAGLTGHQKELNKTLGGGRGAVADLTRVLLQNIGVTGPAGEAAKAAGTAMLFMGGGAGALALAATGVVAVAAVLIPKLIEWGKSTKDTEAATKDLRESILAMLPDLEEYVRTVPNATEELKALYAASRDEAFRKQKDDIEKLTKTISENRAEVERLTASRVDLTVIAGTGGEVIRTVTEATEENRQKAADLAHANENLTASLNALLAAQEDGVLQGGQIHTALDQEKEKRERLKEAIERQKKALEDLKATQDDEAAASLSQNKELLDAAFDRVRIAEDQDRDAQRDMKRESKSQETEGRKRRKEDSDNTLAQIRNRELQVEADKEVADQDAQAAKDKRALDASLIAEGTAALGSFFGKSKAVRIAQAIADTYAGATRAFADHIWPYSAIVAGIVVAQGLANVANIQKAEVGFDDPFSDLLAEKLGRKSAADFVKHFGVGFQGGMIGGGGSTTHTYQTTINRGMTLNGGYHQHSIIGARRTQELKQLTRDLATVARRTENRTRIGG